MLVSPRKYSGSVDRQNTATALRDQLRHVDELWRSSNRQCPNVVSMKRQVATKQLKEKLQLASTATLAKVCAIKLAKGCQMLIERLAGCSIRSSIVLQQFVAASSLQLRTLHTGCVLAYEHRACRSSRGLTRKAPLLQLLLLLQSCHGMTVQLVALRRLLLANWAARSVQRAVKLI
jgi:hypothetical protein